MATGRGGNKIKTRLGFLLYGDYGTWKSSFCLESLKLKNEDGTPFKVLFIDPENGGVDTYLDKYEEQGCDLRNIYIVYTQSLTEVGEFIQRAKNGEDFYEFAFSIKINLIGFIAIFVKLIEIFAILCSLYKLTNLCK